MRWVWAVTLLAAVVVAADVWSEVDYRVAANVSLIVIAVLVTVFTVLYAGRSNWRASRIGRVFLINGTTLSLVLWQAVAAVWAGTDYPGRHHIRFAIYALGAVAYAAMVVTLWREQQRDRAQGRIDDLPPSRPLG